MAVAGRMAPTMTTGLPQLTVASIKKAVSSSVSVPWVITTESIVDPSEQRISLACRARSRRIVELMEGDPTFATWTP
jgi:hypothetical protein